MAQRRENVCTPDLEKCLLHGQKHSRFLLDSGGNNAAYYIDVFDFFLSVTLELNLRIGRQPFAGKRWIVDSKYSRNSSRYALA